MRGPLLGSLHRPQYHASVHYYACLCSIPCMNVLLQFHSLLRTHELFAAVSFLAQDAPTETIAPIQASLDARAPAGELAPTSVSR